MKVKKIFLAGLRLMPTKLRIAFKFYLRQGYWPNIKVPKTFNEKIVNRKVSVESRKFNKFADKFEVRKYVEQKIGSKYLVPLLHVSETLTTDVLKQITGSFVVKCNHDSGNVFIVKEGENIAFEDIVRKINKQLKFDYGAFYDEPWYSNIKPCVIIEQLLVKQDGGQPEDFKFHVFRGDEIILQVDFDRFISHNRSFYDEQGNLLPYSLKYPNLKRKILGVLSRTTLLKMQELAKILAAGFDYVRVDFYSVDEKIYFGEMTFAHESGLGKFSERQHDYIWGEKWL